MLHLNGPHSVVKALNELPLVRREEAWLADGYRVWRRRCMFGAQFAGASGLRRGGTQP
jgi:hypothetical protein